MRVVQAVFGVFHHFELAHQLDSRRMLTKVYSTWPWRRLQREGLPHSKVETFPWIHTADYLLHRTPFGNRRLADELGYLNALAFDNWTAKRMPVCDVLVAISGAGLKTGKLLQERGGRFVCDRGSSHQRYQAEINLEEYRRWGLEISSADDRDTVREEQIYDAADAITVPSTYSLKSFMQQGIDASKLHRIPYGVRLSRFRKEADPLEGSFDVIYVGNISMHKGFPYLLQAFAGLQHPRKRLYMVGSISREMKPVLDKMPLEQVEFVGHVPQEQLKNWMSHAQVLVLPSIDDGFGMVMTQAMACGCPVIATDHTGGPDLIDEGRDGFVVPIRSPEAIREKFELLASTPYLREQMGAAALEKVTKLGGWDTYGDAWEQFLKNLVQ
ncbi:MAG: glycosyltransferase family 4 protein [Acidobacteria bacterium]|nr:glycosyltransferase family 4 protein [Acidobacteriota bacterium]